MLNENKYLNDITKKVNLAYKIANTARSKGYDPEETVSIPLAKNMAERVEGLVSVAAPQIKNSGVPKRIKELEALDEKELIELAKKGKMKTAEKEEEEIGEIKEKHHV